jgi:hypothetical protein
MKWAVHVACMGKKINALRVLVGKLEGRDLLEHVSLDEG